MQIIGIILFFILTAFVSIQTYIAVKILTGFWQLKNEPESKESWARLALGFKVHLRGCVVGGECNVTDSTLHRWIERKQWEIITRRRKYISPTFVVILTTYLRFQLNALIFFIPGIHDIPKRQIIEALSNPVL